jgi:hypothetical protein
MASGTRAARRSTTRKKALSRAGPSGRYAQGGPVAAFALSLFACGQPVAPSCTASISQPIYGGTADAASLGIEAVAGAVGALTTQTDSGVPELCSGVLVAPRFLLTAAHCSSAPSTGAMSVTFGPTAYAFASAPCAVPPADMYGVSRVVRHPTSDAMLVELSSDARGIEPTAISGTSPSLGTKAIIAGYGVTEAGTAGALMFVATTITQADNGLVTVDSGPDAGACAGDSGGPLFLQGPDASWQVAGVLSRGSAYCMGLDLFTSATDIRSWIMATIAAP